MPVGKTPQYSSLRLIRTEYHAKLLNSILGRRRSTHGPITNADKDNESSKRIAEELAKLLAAKIGTALKVRNVSPQRAGKTFTQYTKDFLHRIFSLLQHLRPGTWSFDVESAITNYDQYSHLAGLQRVLQSTFRQDPGLKVVFGTDYLVTPDIVIARRAEPDKVIDGGTQPVLAESAHKEAPLACHTPLRQTNNPDKLILHASISCKWTIRSDRAQNTRAEALNLVRNRKGKLPHVVAVTAEPLATRIASLALGTGDLDCVYHFALPELRLSTDRARRKDQLDMLDTMINGRRLRDISDLPFDLAI